MKHISNKLTALLTALNLVVLTMTGCSSPINSIVYESTDLSAYVSDTLTTGSLGGFAENLCVANEDIIPDDMESAITAYAAGLFDITDREVL